MKKRSILKKQARASVKNHYFRNVLLVFLASIIIAGGYKYSTSDLINISPKEEVEKGSYSFPYEIGIKDKSEVINDLFHKKDRDKSNEERLKEKYNRGILSVFVNKIYESDSFVFGILNAFNQLIFRNNISVFITIILTAFILLAIKLLIQNVIVIGQNRYFLEHRKYRGTKIDKLLFPYKVKKNWNLVWILLVKYIYQFLWNLTIIGGIIKHYEYLMIPYVLAENPNITKKEAFKLSKEMMNGYKFATFKLDFSLLGWDLLGVVTLGLTNIFYTDIYKECIFAELYMNLRTNLQKTYPKLLNDKLLDIKKEVTTEYPKDEYKVSFRAFRKWLNIDYKRDYSFSDYILFFATFSFIGWLYEVFIHLIQTGVFVNRGAMLGPWLPIYGYGGVLILLFLKPLREKPWLLFLCSLLLCGLIEYGTSLYLETFNHMKWWNYSGYFLNIQGRVCLEGLIVFGLAGAGVTYLFAPTLDDLFKQIKPKVKVIICTLIIILYALDLVYSIIKPNQGNGITTDLESTKEIITIEKDLNVC